VDPAVRRQALLGLVIALGCRNEPETPADVPELGAVSMPRVVTGRDGGAAALVAGRMLWTFNDTLMTVNGADGFSYRSATAACADGDSLALDEPLDPNGAPYQLLPYTADEIAYNRSRGPQERFALWPDAVVPDGSGGALVFFAYLKVHPGNLDFEPLGAGVARVGPGETVAYRYPDLLFVAPEPQFVNGGVIVDGFVHLYGCDPVPDAIDSECRVARAPLGQATARAAWQVWNGAAWSSDLRSGQTVLHGAPGQVSVSWNPYLGSYLAVHGAILSNEVVFHTAPHPEGPWSDARHLFTGRHGSSQSDYAALEHPELARDAGRTLVVSYADPSESFGGTLRLALPTLP
jgi:hypothetical protein